MLSSYRDNSFWKFVADKFHEKLKNDPLLRYHFRGRSAGESEMINFNIFRAGFGEELTYYHDAIREAHRDRGITPDQVNRFIFVLKTVLTEAELEEEEVKLIISRINNYGNIIIQLNNSY